MKTKKIQTIEKEHEKRKRSISLKFCVFYLILGSFMIYLSLNPTEPIQLVLGGFFVGYGMRGILFK